MTSPVATTAAALELLVQVLAQGARISQIVRTAQAEGREQLTDEEKTAIKGDLDEAIARLERATS